MTHILHISDPHGQSEVMKRLNNLARSRPPSDIVALTGDCITSAKEQLTDDWNHWPQIVKLAVPGDHDEPDNTFANLHSWTWQTPWRRQVDDLLFVGVNILAKDQRPRQIQYLCDLGEGVSAGVRGVVILSHIPLDIPFGFNKLCSAVSDLVGEKPALLLHGDQHPKWFCGVEWDESYEVADKRIARSNVCSSGASGRPRGLAHLIEWDGRRFTAERIQGNLHT